MNIFEKYLHSNLMFAPEKLSFIHCNGVSIFRSPRIKVSEKKKVFSKESSSSRNYDLFILSDCLPVSGSQS